MYAYFGQNYIQPVASKTTRAGVPSVAQWVKNLGVPVVAQW